MSQESDQNIADRDAGERYGKRDLLYRSDIKQGGYEVGRHRRQNEWIEQH